MSATFGPAVETSSCCPGPASGSGMPTISRTSGPPKRVIRTAGIPGAQGWATAGSSAVPAHDPGRIVYPDMPVAGPWPEEQRSATTSTPHAQPGLLCNDAMTSAETVLAFHQAVEFRDDSAFGLVAEDLIQHAARPQGREVLRKTLASSTSIWTSRRQPFIASRPRMDPNRIEPGPVIEWISRHLSDDAEAVWIGGSGFRAARAIEALEERPGRPVLESNQVLLWSTLAKVDANFHSAAMDGCSVSDLTVEPISNPSA